MKDLETKRLLLSKIKLNDSELLFETLLRDKDTLLFLDWPFCNEIDESRKFVNKIISNIERNKHYFWIIREKNTKDFVGCICICNYDENKRLAEIEYALNPEYRGKGYMCESLQNVIEYLINECNVYRVEAVCNIENVPSSKCMERAGMRFEGILRGRALNMNEEGNPGDLKIYSFIKDDFVIL